MHNINFITKFATFFKNLNFTFMNTINMPNSYGVKLVELKSVKKGDFFVLKEPLTDEVNENNVWIKGDYDRSSKSYSCYKYTDYNHEHFFKSNKKVYIDFTF